MPRMKPDARKRARPSPVRGKHSVPALASRYSHLSRPPRLRDLNNREVNNGKKI